MASILSNLSISISRIGQLWQEKHNALIFRWILILTIGQLILIFVKFNDLPPQIPLYYSLPWGANGLASSSALFIIPVASIIIFLVNSILAAFSLIKHILFSRLLLIFSLLFSLLSLYTLTRIIFLVS